MNLLRSFLSPLNILGVLIRISLGVMVAMLSSSSLLYSDVSSCDVVSSDSVSGLALDVVAVGHSGDESGDAGSGLLSWCYLVFLVVDSVVCRELTNCLVAQLVVIPH